MYTKFGEFMRVLRIKHHEIMGDIADMLGVSLPFLSAVENGKRNVPADWVDKIVSHYNLSPEETQELLEAIEQSKTQMKLDLKSSEFFQRTAAGRPTAAESRAHPMQSSGHMWQRVRSFP